MSKFVGVTRYDCVNFLVVVIVVLTVTVVVVGGGSVVGGADAVKIENIHFKVES